MKRMAPLFIAILSGLLSILAAYYQFRIKEDERKEKNIQKEKALTNEKLALEFQEKLIQKTESLDSANAEITRLQSRLLANTNLLLDESKNVQIVQSETIKFLTGEGFPILDFYNKGKGTISLIFYNKTKYPIYDVRVRIDDFDEIVRCIRHTTADSVYLERECVLKVSKHSGPIFMAPGQNSPVDFDMNFEGRKHYRIEIITRRDIYEYYCIIERNSSFIKYCIRTYHQLEGKPFLEDEREFGMASPDEKYWNEYLLADKVIYFGPIENGSF